MPTVTSWHNVQQDESGHPTAMLVGFSAGDPLVPVDQFTLGGNLSADGYLAVCDFVFELFNVGDDSDFGVPDARAVAYRGRGNRSLSVGDVIQIDRCWFAVTVTGFAVIAAPSRLDGISQPGSTRIDLPRDFSPATDR